MGVLLEKKLSDRLEEHISTVDVTVRETAELCAGGLY